MKDTLESLRHKIERATELGAVVRSMKALSASSIHQYELAAKSLEDYYRTVQLGLHVCAPQLKDLIRPSPGKKEKTGAIVFGSGRLRMMDMVRAGLLIDLLGVILVTLTVLLIAVNVMPRP